jgi:hypothetical protein
MQGSRMRTLLRQWVLANAIAVPVLRCLFGVSQDVLMYLPGKMFGWL